MASIICSRRRKPLTRQTEAGPRCRAHQRTKLLQQVVVGPWRAGISAQGAPVRKRWLMQLAQRCNQFGPDALGDRGLSNATSARLLTPELLDKLRARLKSLPPDGGVWNTTKIAAFMASELGLASVYPQRAWDALQAIGWSIQAPRPKNPASAGPEERAAFKKICRDPRRGRSAQPRTAGRALLHGRAPHRGECSTAARRWLQVTAQSRIGPPYGGQAHNQVTLNLSSGSGGVWFVMYSTHISSVTLPLVATQYPRAQRCWPQ